MRTRYCATSCRELARPFSIASRICGTPISTTLNAKATGRCDCACATSVRMPAATAMDATAGVRVIGGYLTTRLDARLTPARRRDGPSTRDGTPVARRRRLSRSPAEARPAADAALRDLYSVRSATIGSTRVARRAGAIGGTGDTPVTMANTDA